MKRLLLFVLVVMLIAFLPEKGECQGEAYGVAGAGISFEETGTFAMFIGGDISIYKDTARGFSSFTRATYHFSDRDNDKETQGFAVWQMIRRDVVSWVYVAIGGGLSYNVKTGDDQKVAGVKIEAGIAPWSTIALIIGVEYQPNAGENAGDVKFVYAGINLLP